MEPKCETCSKRDECTKIIGYMFGFCNTDYEEEKNMSLEMVTGIVRKETMKEDMKNLMSFDFDFVGDNGTEFTSDEANAVGKTDFEYEYDRCNSEKYGLIFDRFFEAFYYKYSSYYYDLKYEITPIGENEMPYQYTDSLGYEDDGYDGYVITIAYVTEE